MKKQIVTEEKVINTPAGGVLIGKDKEGQTIIPNDGSLGGFLTGKLHKDGGIKAIVKSTGQPIEMQANEIVITAPAVADTTKRNFQGKMMTNRQILSKINEDGGGLAFADGGEMPSSFKPKGKKYTYGGKLMSDSDILKDINECGCEHDSEDSKKKMKYGGNLSKGMTLGDIANRHNVSLKHINEQLLMGVEKEKEHGGTKAERIAIAKDHLVENPNYYSLVEKAGLEFGGTFDSKPFLDYYHSEIAEFLKDQNGIKLDNDYTFRHKGEKFTVQPMILVDKESDQSIKKADFVITDSEDEEVGEITFDSSKKKKFEANSDFFEWNQILFYNGGYSDGGNTNSFTVVEIEDDLKEMYQNQAYKNVGGTDFFFSRLNVYPSQNVFTIELPDGNEVGRATLNEKGNYLTNIRVDENYRRKGLAMMLYDYIELTTEKRLNPSPDKISMEARNLWSKRNANIAFKYGGELQRKDELVKDAKKGNSPSRDLNNYNDLLDVQEDGVVGNHVDFPEQGASGASVAFADGGDISFLNDVDKFFDDGGSTGGSEKPNVFNVTIVKTHATTDGIDKYQELVGKSFIDWTSLKTELRKVFKEQGKLIGAFTIQINDNQKAKIFIKFDDKKNTVANFNPLTGVFSDFKKQALRNQPTTFNSFDWNDFQSSNNKQQQPKTQSSAKPVLEYVEVSNYTTYPKLKDVKISSLFEFYNILIDNTKDSLELFQTLFISGSDTLLVNIFFKAEGNIDKDTFITSGTTFEDFKEFFLKLPIYKDGKVVDTVLSAFDTDKFIGGESEAKTGEAKSSDKEVVQSLTVYEILGRQKDSKDIVGLPRFEIDTFYSSLKDFAEKNKDVYAVRVDVNASVSETHRFSIVINKTSGLTHFDFETKNLDDFKKYILTRVNYETKKELRSDFDFTSFFGEESGAKDGESKNEKTTLKYVELLGSPKDVALLDIYDLQIEVNSLVNKNDTLQTFRTYLNGNDSDPLTFFARNTGSQDDDTFVTTGKTTDDFIKFFTNLSLKKGGKLTDKFNLDIFLGIGKVNRISYAFTKKDRQVDSGFVYSSKEFLDKAKEAWDTGLKMDNGAVLFATIPVVEGVIRAGLTRVFYLSNKPLGYSIQFNPEKESLQDLENLLQNKWVGNSGSKNNERLDWSEFFGTKTDEQSSSTKPILEYVEITNTADNQYPELKNVKIDSLYRFYNTLIEIVEKKDSGNLFDFSVDFEIKGEKRSYSTIFFSTHGEADSTLFITSGTTFKDFKEFFLALEIYKDGKSVGKVSEALNADKFIGEQSNQTDEETKEESKPQETVDFEIERKYLFTRINSLSKELDFKRPSLTNEEIGFYSREINKLVLRLRKVTEKQESLKPISERLKAIYSVKWGDYGKEYPETTLMSVNGSKSELTESEYQVVRNFEFKSFFGDWEKAYLEKNPSSASQIVNPKTMEPMAVYHGTDVLFTDWKTYATNNAHYFSKKRSFANWFASSWEDRSDKAGVDSKILKQLNPNKGKFVYRCFLDIRKPVDFSRFGVEKRPVKEFLVFLKINYGIGDYDFWTGLGNASAVTAETPVFAWQIIRLWQNFTMYIKAYTTYDGYIFYEYNPDTPSGGLDNASLCFCAFESSQVKFTEAYEFSALSNDSRFDLGGEL